MEGRVPLSYNHSYYCFILKKSKVYSYCMIAILKIKARHSKNGEISLCLGWQKLIQTLPHDDSSSMPWSKPSLVIFLQHTKE
jgi:hypothetical protein